MRSNAAMMLAAAATLYALATPLQCTALPLASTPSSATTHAQPATALATAAAAASSGTTVLYYNTAQTCGSDWLSLGDYDAAFLFSEGCAGSYAPLTDAVSIPSELRASGKAVYLVIGSGTVGFSEADLQGLAGRAAAQGFAGVQLEMEAGCEGCTDTADFMRIISTFIDDCHAQSPALKVGLTTGGSGNTAANMCGVPGICAAGCQSGACAAGFDHALQEQLLESLAALAWDHWAPQTYAADMSPAPEYGWFAYWSKFAGELLPAVADSTHMDHAQLDAAYLQTPDAKALASAGLTATGLAAFPWNG